MKQEKAFTYVQALNMYFGGVKMIAQVKSPYVCIVCGQNYTSTFSRDKDGNKIETKKYTMLVEDCFFHVRKRHKERIKLENKSVT